MRKDKVEIDLSIGREWTNKNFEVDLQAQIAKGRAEDQRRFDIEHADPVRQSREDWRALAFTLGIEADELHLFMSEDSDRTTKIISIATTLIEHQVEPEGTFWDDAERIYEKRMVHLMKHQDKTSTYQNSRKPLARYPQEPKPRTIYENPHKRRSQKGWRQLLTIKMKREKYTDEERSGAINNEDLDRHSY